MTRKKKISATAKSARKIWPSAAPTTLSPLPRERLLKMCPTVEGPVTVSFKHEDSISGMAIGPVVVTAREPYEAWLKLHGAPYSNGRGPTRYLVPFGSVPDGQHTLGWVTKHVALEVAVHYGVALEEF